MKDRIPTYPGRVKLTPVGNNIYDMERADQPTEAGTALNKANLFDSTNEMRYSASTVNEALKYMVREWEVTVLANGWTEGTDYSTQRINVTGMKAVYNPIYASNPASVLTVESEAQGFSMITEMETFDGYVIFKAIDVPDTDVRVKIRGV